MPNLTIEQIEVVAASFKEDMDRKMRRMVRRHDSNGALAVLEAMEYINDFLDTLKLRAGSHLQEYLSKPPRARAIHLSPKIINR